MRRAVGADGADVVDGDVVHPPVAGLVHHLELEHRLGLTGLHPRDADRFVLLDRLFQPDDLDLAADVLPAADPELRLIGSLDHLPQELGELFLLGGAALLPVAAQGASRQRVPVKRVVDQRLDVGLPLILGGPSFHLLRGEDPRLVDHPLEPGLRRRDLGVRGKAGCRDGDDGEGEDRGLHSGSGGTLGGGPAFTCALRHHRSGCPRLCRASTSPSESSSRSASAHPRRWRER